MAYDTFKYKCIKMCFLFGHVIYGPHRSSFIWNIFFSYLHFVKTCPSLPLNVQTKWICITLANHAGSASIFNFLFF